jgi:hypothetical protein
MENCHRNSGFTHWKWWFSIEGKWYALISLGNEYCDYCSIYIPVIKNEVAKAFSSWGDLFSPRTRSLTHWLISPHFRTGTAPGKSCRDFPMFRGEFTLPAQEPNHGWHGDGSNLGSISRKRCLVKSMFFDFFVNSQFLKKAQKDIKK